MLLLLLSFFARAEPTVFDFGPERDEAFASGATCSDWATLEALVVVTTNFELHHRVAFRDLDITARGRHAICPVYVSGTGLFLFSFEESEVVDTPWYEAIEQSGSGSTPGAWRIVRSFQPDNLEDYVYPPGSHAIVFGTVGFGTTPSTAVDIEASATIVYGRDWDGDGYASNLLPDCDQGCSDEIRALHDGDCPCDCDDDNPLIYPGAPEQCDDVDWNCNGETNEGLELLQWYVDADNDGWGSDLIAPIESCFPPDESTNWVHRGGDCDDADEDINPDATEIPYDRIDQDCSGHDLVDIDGDTYAGIREEDWLAKPDGDPTLDWPSHLSEGLDCVDTNPSINPGAEEVAYDRIDQNCDGQDLLNIDGDPYAGTLQSTWESLDNPQGLTWPEGLKGDEVDCNDEVASIYPGAPEVAYDRIDQSCDGQDLLDVDTDGYPGISQAAYLAIDDGDDLPWPAVFLDKAEDCDDSDEDIHPDAPEILYDRIDQDCDTFDLVDFDGDSYPGILRTAWEALPVHPNAPGLWPPEVRDEPLDCDDFNASISPEGVEIPYDRIDQDCTNADLVDVDGDTFPGILQAEWEAIEGADDSLVWPGGLNDELDCNDEDELVYPDAPEIPYDRVDQSCDGQDLLDVDTDGFPGISQTAYLAIDDGDDLPWPDPFIDKAEDCDDKNPSIFPGAIETPYDRIDQSCDGQDLLDLDKDAYAGIARATWEALPDPSGLTWPSELFGEEDCDDDDPLINPGVDEVPYDRIDQNCTGFDLVDVDGDAFPGILQTEWEAIEDGDDSLVWPGGLEGELDCNDEDDTVYPGAEELPYDRIDQSCDGQDLLDVDEDGFPGISELAYLDIHDADDLPWPEIFDDKPEDCDDKDETIFPGATEIPYDRIDQSCDGQDLLDRDSDRYAGIERSTWEALPDGDPTLHWPEGLNEALDCDDTDPTINPGAEEVPYDRIDQDCDRLDLVDVDGDTWPGILRADWELLDLHPNAPGDWQPGVRDEPLDCDDNDPEINPGATEQCDEIDWNCDGDPYLGAEGANDWYPDNDGDGFGDLEALEPEVACQSPEEGDWVTNNEDCDDNDDTIYPGAEEVPYDRVDQSCDGQDLLDLDADGFAGIERDTWEALPDPSGLSWPEGLDPREDCDDNDKTIYPDAEEVPYDRVDQSCDGQDLLDLDADGFAGIEQATWEALPEGDPALSWPDGMDPRQDCDDNDKTIYPDAPETPYDRIDQSCDGQDLLDIDADGFAGIEQATWEALDNPQDLIWPPVFEGRDLDCDDNDNTIYPDAPETPYDRIDQSCDGQDLLDVDFDGFAGVARATWEALPDPSGLSWPAAFAEKATDCDDTDPLVFPGADEIAYDRIDQSCDGQDLLDVDTDGFAGIERATWEALPDPSGLSWPEGLDAREDCVDTDDTIYPDAPETPYDRVDQSCDGNDLLDVDADGFAGIERSTWEALPDPQELDWPTAYEGLPVDCDDTDKSIYPDAPEIPYDRIDQSCDTWDLVDVDGDLYPGVHRADWEALAVHPSAPASWPDGLFDESWDCDDEDPDIFPGADEIPGDGIDQSCSGTEDCFLDRDSDGWRTHDLEESGPGDLTCTETGLALASAPDGDCDDTDPEIHPGADEIWYDGIDQNCDGWSDFDPDGDRLIWPDYAERDAAFFERLEAEPTTLDTTDCYDALDTTLSDARGAIDPGDIPRDRRWYNGIDDDCSALQVELDEEGGIVAGALVVDFDQDGDGYLLHDSRDAFLDYVERYVHFERAEHPELEPPELGPTPIRDVFLATFGPDRAAWEHYYETWGGDCDDEDPDVIPGDPAFDEDCERLQTQSSRALPGDEQGTAPLGTGCACEASSTGGPGGLLAVLGLLGALSVRRRR